MKKVFIIVALFACSAFSINPFSYYWTIKLTGDTATVAKWKANNDSVLNWSTRVCDTLKPASIPRWNMFRNHDSTFRWMNIDTIKGPVRLDSIKGPLFADTVRSNSLTVGVIDSVYSAKGVKATVGEYSSTVNVDSLNSTKGIKAPRGTFSGVVNVDSLYSTKTIAFPGLSTTTGTFSGTVIVDSLKSTKMINGNLKGTSDSSVKSAHTVLSDSAKSSYSAIISDSAKGSYHAIISDSAKGAHHLSGGTVAATSISGTILDIQNGTGKSIVKIFDTTLGNNLSFDLGNKLGFSSSITTNGYGTVVARYNSTSGSSFMKLFAVAPAVVNGDAIFNTADSTTGTKINIYPAAVTGALRLKNTLGYTATISVFFMGQLP